MTARTAILPAAIPWRLVGFLAVIVGWEILARANADSYILAGPLAVVAHLAGHAGLLVRATLTTLDNAVWGFLWGNLVAIGLAILVVLAPRLERLVAALALLVFCLPLVATGPILRVLYGAGDGPQITLASLAVFYTTFLALMVGLRAVPQSWLDLVRTHGRGAGAQLVHVRAAASVPYLIAGLQIAAPAAFLGAMIGEFTGAERGLGVLTIRAMRGLDVDATWAIA
ncbi:MAG: ABC transporter permease subunit, partial [Pseudomonadota bacterium]